MPRYVASRMYRRRSRSQSLFRMLPPILAAAVASLVVVGGSSAATLNTAQLDNGTCGRNLQLGSDKTASTSATPSFLIAGDGGLSSYEAFVDGARVGTFYSDGFANVCVYDTMPLADGPHVLTANELLPHSTWTITPFNFTVDTVPPAQPSTPSISGYSDSGLQGDHITMYRNVNFSGFADPNVTDPAVQRRQPARRGEGRRGRGLVGDDLDARRRQLHLYRGRARPGRQQEHALALLPADDRRHRADRRADQPARGRDRQRHRPARRHRGRPGRHLEGRLPGRRDDQRRPLTELPVQLPLGLAAGRERQPHPDAR